MSLPMTLGGTEVHCFMQQFICTCRIKFISIPLESREMHGGQLEQCERSVKMTDRASSKYISIQGKRNVQGVVGIGDATVDEFGHREV